MSLISSDWTDSLELKNLSLCPKYMMRFSMKSVKSNCPNPADLLWLSSTSIYSSWLQIKGKLCKSLNLTEPNVSCLAQVFTHILSSLTSLRCFEAERMTARPVSSAVKGHDNEAVFRERPKPCDHCMVPLAWECQCVFLTMGFLWVQQTTKPPIAYLYVQEIRLVHR